MKPNLPYGIQLVTGGEWVCMNHPPDNKRRPWCEHIQEWFRSNNDSYWIEPGITLTIPVIPTQGIWTQVRIEDTDPAEYGGACPMEMVYTNDFGQSRKIRLGFWNLGEGIMVIRDCIVDYIRSNVDPEENWNKESTLKTKCPNRAHSLKSNRIIADSGRDPAWRWACLWNIVMEGACTPCVEETSSAVRGNFGVDDSVAAGRPRWS